MPARSDALSGVGCNKYRSAIKPGVVPYAANLYAYIFVANVLAVVIVVRWVKPVGFMVSMAFGLVFAYLWIELHSLLKALAAAND